MKYLSSLRTKIYKLCQAVRARFVKARMGGEGDDKRTDVFLDNKNRLFRYEMEYDREMSPDVERTRRQQDLPAMEAMINLRANLLQESKSGGGAEKLLYAESLELSSQVLEGNLHLL